VTAISVRIEARKSGIGQKNHDLRKGRVPAYVDQGRSRLNRVIHDEGMSDSAIKAEIMRVANEVKQKGGVPGRLMVKSNLVINGIITFGRDFDTGIDRLELDNAAIDYLHYFGKRFGAWPLRLVRHEDEYRTHYHFAFINQNRKTARSVSRIIRRGDLINLQDKAGEIFAHLGFTRGTPKVDRVQSHLESIGVQATPDALLDYNVLRSANVIHQSVREMHEAIPRELADAKKKLDRWQAMVRDRQNTAPADDQAQVQHVMQQDLEDYRQQVEAFRREISRLEKLADTVRRENSTLQAINSLLGGSDKSIQQEKQTEV